MFFLNRIMIITDRFLQRVYARRRLFVISLAFLAVGYLGVAVTEWAGWDVAAAAFSVLPLAGLVALFVLVVVALYEAECS